MTGGTRAPASGQGGEGAGQSAPSLQSSGHGHLQSQLAPSLPRSGTGRTLPHPRLGQEVAAAHALCRGARLGQGKALARPVREPPTRPINTTFLF